jgi:hypothetical protein
MTARKTPTIQDEHKKLVSRFKREYTISMNFKESIRPIVAEWVIIFFKIKHRDMAILDGHVHDFDIGGNTFFDFNYDLLEDGVRCQVQYNFPDREPFQDTYLIQKHLLLYTTSQRSSYLNDRINKSSIGFNRHTAR